MHGIFQNEIEHSQFSLWRIMIEFLKINFKVGCYFRIFNGLNDYVQLEEVCFNSYLLRDTIRAVF